MVEAGLLGFARVRIAGYTIALRLIVLGHVQRAPNDKAGCARASQIVTRTSSP